MNDSIANKIRIMLKTQSQDKSLQGQCPTDNGEFKFIFSRDFHWVLFINNSCYVQLFGMACVIPYTQNGSFFEEPLGILYKFCYKSKTYKKMYLEEHLKSLVEK